METQVSLNEQEWQSLLGFVDGWLAEIAQYDDEDERYLAVQAIRAKIDAQLRPDPASAPR